MLGMLDEEQTKFEKWLAEKLGKGVDKVVMAFAIILAVILSVALFIALPAGVESLLRGAGMSTVGYTLIGGLVKIILLVGYTDVAIKITVFLQVTDYLFRFVVNIDDDAVQPYFF